jgi:type VI secretion system protein ImpM
LEEDINLDDFDHKLQDHPLPLPFPTAEGHEQISARFKDNGGAAIRIEMERLGQMPEAFIELGACLLTRFVSSYSLWCTNGSERVNPSLLVYGGLPPPDAFADLLTGDWRQSGANLTATSPLFYGPQGLKAGATRPSSEIEASDSLKWRSFGRSTVGKVRERNEDAFLENSESGVWAVADGMGGHSAGDEASKTVVDALLATKGADTIDALIAEVTTALRETNADLIRLAQEKENGLIMGSTVVALLAVGERCAAVWAGDSRLYRRRGGLLSQLTRDHSPGAETRRLDSEAPEASEDGGHSNIVTRALGAVKELTVDVLTFEAKPGDIYLLCSDGLTKEVAPQEMAELLGQSGPDDSSRALIDLALARGARDNVTVVVVTADREAANSNRKNT